MITILFSGGMDSLVHLRWATRVFGLANVQTRYIDFGQQYAQKEIEAAQFIASRLGITFEVMNWKGVVTENIVDAHIPLRNTFLILQAAAQENCTGVVFGMLYGEASEDKNPSYVRSLQKLLNSQFQTTVYRPKQKEFKIYTPFQKCTKAQMLKWYLKSIFGDEHKYEEVIYTSIGCYSAARVPCGRCGSCFNRWVALTLNGLGEQYQFPPGEWGLKNMAGLKAAPIHGLSKLYLLREAWKKHKRVFEDYKALNLYTHKRYEKSLLQMYFGS